VILLKIDSENVIAIELERDAPRPVDMDRVAGWIEAFERVKIEAGKVQLIERDQNIKARQANHEPPVHAGIDLARSAGVPKVCQRLALKLSIIDVS